MTRAQILLIAGGLGVGAYLFRERLAALFAGDTGNKSNLFGIDLGGIMDQLNTSLGNLRDPDSEERKGLRNLDRARAEVFAGLGLTGDPNRKKKQLSQLASSSLAERLGAERWAQRMYSFASRADVREWVVDASGLTIFYEGRATPWTMPVPSSALYPSAWILEASSRMLGSPVQREEGPFGFSAGKGGRLGAWIRYEEPAFSDTNPSAPPDFTISGLYNPPTFGPVLESQNPLLQVSA